MLFKFQPLIFFIFKFGSYSFDFYFFCLKSFFKLILFYDSTLLCFFFLSNSILILLIVNFFLTSFKIHILKLVCKNLFIRPRSRVSWITSFKDLIKLKIFALICLVFYFPLSKLIFFLFHPLIFIQ